MFTLVTRGLQHHWSLESCLCDSSPATTQRLNSDSAAIGIVVYIAAASLNVTFDFYSWMPNGSPTMKSPPPSTKGATTLQTVLDSLPDVNTTATGLVTVWQLGNEPLDRRRLGNYREAHFIEETPKKLIQEFQMKLNEISKIINDRNQTRRLSYLYLDPKKIENGVSI
ncbi:unnamed protein product [Ranitomeya imitator]|uniref:Lipoxygenase domain-containing protein n=1 Tax=Ranitomeya imitator TaxID=111125 RepID=A0ABN9LID2_9NEOB|nr:unnamed protein product [Ranitomeya imitator]